MSRERILERRLRTLHTLEEAVNALRSMSAQHFRRARALLPSVRAYHDEVQAILGVLEPVRNTPASHNHEAAGIVLIAADLGLCGDYATSLVRETVAARTQLGGGPLFCLGRRALAQLERAGLQPDRLHPSPASVGAIPHLLFPLVDEIVDMAKLGQLDSLTLVAAHFEGAGSYRPLQVRVLPVGPSPDQPKLQASPYCGSEHLQDVVIREYLYAVLFEALLGALASEHGKRLVIAESARTWLAERIERTHRLVAEIRREQSTQEVLEVANAARGGHFDPFTRQTTGESWVQPI